jgi:hypothetical protein
MRPNGATGLRFPSPFMLFLTVYRNEETSSPEKCLIRLPCWLFVHSRCATHMVDAGEAELNGENDLPRSISSQQQQRVCERGRAASITARPLSPSRICFFFLVVCRSRTEEASSMVALRLGIREDVTTRITIPPFSTNPPHRDAPRPQRPISNFYDGHDATVAFYLGTGLLWVIANDMIGAKLENVSDRMRSRRINSIPSSRRAFQTCRSGPPVPNCAEDGSLVHSATAYSLSSHTTAFERPNARVIRKLGASF